MFHCRNVAVEVEVVYLLHHCSVLLSSPSPSPSPSPPSPTTWFIILGGLGNPCTLTHFFIGNSIFHLLICVHYKHALIKNVGPFDNSYKKFAYIEVVSTRRASEILFSPKYKTIRKILSLRIFLSLSIQSATQRKAKVAQDFASSRFSLQNY